MFIISGRSLRVIPQKKPCGQVSRKVFLYLEELIMRDLCQFFCIVRANYCYLLSWPERFAFLCSNNGPLILTTPLELKLQSFGGVILSDKANSYRAFILLFALSMSHSSLRLEITWPMYTVLMVNFIIADSFYAHGAANVSKLILVSAYDKRKNEFRPGFFILANKVETIYNKSFWMLSRFPCERRRKGWFSVWVYLNKGEGPVKSRYVGRLRWVHRNNVAWNSYTHNPRTLIWN